MLVIKGKECVQIVHIVQIQNQENVDGIIHHVDPWP